MHRTASNWTKLQLNYLFTFVSLDRQHALLWSYVCQFWWSIACTLHTTGSQAILHELIDLVCVIMVYLYCHFCRHSVYTRGWFSWLVKVVRWRPSCQTQKHFSTLHLSWLCQSIECKREINGEKPFYSTMPCCLYTTQRLFNWNATLYFDKDIEVQRL